MTRSTLARLYQLRSNRTISPAEGNSATYRWKYHCPRSLSVGVARATTRHTRGFSGSVMRLMTPPLPAASRPSKMTHILRRLCLTYSCNLISSLRGFAWFRSVTHDPVLLDFCGLPCQLHHFAARVLVFVLLLHVDPPVLIAMAGRLSSRVTDKIRRLRRLLRGSTSAACGPSNRHRHQIRRGRARVARGDG